METDDYENSAVTDALALGQIDRASLLLCEGSPLDLQRAAKVVIDKGQCEALTFLLSNYKLDVNKHFLLHRALVVKQEDVAKLLVESGANVNIYDETGSRYRDCEEQGCAHYSSYLPVQLSLFCSFDMTRFLLESGADINTRNHLDETPLIFACSIPIHTVLVAFLLVKGAKVYAKDRIKATALHWAVRVGNTETITLLIDHGADIEAEDAFGCTPLMWACSNSEGVGCLKILLGKRASCQSKNIYEETGLHEAAKSGNSMALELLIQFGAQIEARTLNGDTALILACGEYVPAECVRILLEKGAFPNVKNRNRKTPLKLAMEARGVKKIQMLFQYGATKEDRIDQEETELMQACRKTGNVKSVLSLLQSNISPNVKNKRGRTVLHMVAYIGDIETLKVLVQYKADVNAMTDNDKTPLTLACGNSSVNVECVKFLLENNALPNVTDCMAITALHRAVLSRDIDKVKILVKHGADVNARDVNMKTPLMLACALKQEYVNLLLKIKFFPIRTNCTSQTVLHSALERNMEHIKVREECGADVNVKDGQDQRSLLLAFNVECAKLLLTNKAFPNVIDCMGQTVLHSVVAAGDMELVKILVQHGADVNAKNRTDQTPLMLACAQNFGNVECVKYLLQSKALPNLANIRGETALHMAAFAGDVEKLRIIVQYGVDVNRTDGNKKTPLMLVCGKKSVNVKCAEFLLENKALPNMADIRGDTALHMAVRAGDIEKVTILVKYGADVNVKDKNQETPLMLASATGFSHMQCVTFLLGKKA